MTAVWALLDDRAGHQAQVRGVVQKLGLPYLLKPLHFNATGRLLPPGLQGATLGGLMHESRATLNAPWPKLVIAAGRRTLPALRYIKRVSPQTVTVYLMWPGSMRGIDLIVAPEHDNPPHSTHVIPTLAPLHALTRETLADAATLWQPRFASLPKPWVALCLGGHSRHGKYRPEDWSQLLQQAQTEAGGGSLLITSSRRTPPEALAAATALACPHDVYRWEEGTENPYLGMLALADAIIVTGDSLSMCAEACFTGKPVAIFAPAHAVPPKHARLHRALYARGAAHPLGEAPSPAPTAMTETFDEAAMVANEIRSRFPAVCGT